MTDNVGEVGSWTALVEDRPSATAGFQNNNCFECDRSPSLQDVPDVIRWTMRYDLPFGTERARLRSGALSHVLGDWSFAGFFTWDNGTPVRVQSPNDSNSFGGGTFMRPNVTGISPVIDDRTMTDNALYFTLRHFHEPPHLRSAMLPGHSTTCGTPESVISIC